MTAQLIDAGNGYHLWSETYERGDEDIFALQDEVTAAIATQLEQRIGKLGARSGAGRGEGRESSATCARTSSTSRAAQHVAQAHAGRARAGARAVRAGGRGRAGFRRARTSGLADTYLLRGRLRRA